MQTLPRLPGTNQKMLAVEACKGVADLVWFGSHRGGQRVGRNGEAEGVGGTYQPQRLTLEPSRRVGQGGNLCGEDVADSPAGGRQRDELHQQAPCLPQCLLAFEDGGQARSRDRVVDLPGGGVGEAGVDDGGIGADIGRQVLPPDSTEDERSPDLAPPSAGPRARRQPGPPKGGSADEYPRGGGR